MHHSAQHCAYCIVTYHFSCTGRALGWMCVYVSVWTVASEQNDFDLGVCHVGSP